MGKRMGKGRRKANARQKAFSNVSTLYIVACRRRTHNTCLHTACIAPCAKRQPSPRPRLIRSRPKSFLDDREQKEEEEEGILILISLIRNSKDTARGRGDERVKERKDGEDGRGEGGDERGSELKE